MSDTSSRRLLRPRQRDSVQCQMAFGSAVGERLDARAPWRGVDNNVQLPDGRRRHEMSLLMSAVPNVVCDTLITNCSHFFPQGILPRVPAGAAPVRDVSCSSACAAAV